MRVKNIFKNKKGITLIALVITIIILLILAGVAISIVNGSGLLGRADETRFKTKLSQIAEDWIMYRTSLRFDDEDDKINAGKILTNIVSVNEMEDVDIDSIQDIRSILSSVGRTEENYIIIYQGELYYVSQPTISNNANQAKWAEDIGIPVWEFSGVVSGIQVVNGNYELVKGVYLCTPKLDTGFVKDNTRYIKMDNNNHLVAGNWINKRPSDDWYDYANKKWANIYVESNGADSYYVWIPRYVYKTVSGERVDAKFVDIDNSYKDPNTDEVTTWEQLQAQGYILPEAFTWGDGSDNNTPIPGYWMSKYQLSEITNSSNYIVDFSTAATASTIKIQNISTNTTKTIAKYVYAMNGRIVHESTTPEDYTITGLARGDKAVNVTLLDSNNEIIGSMTKIYEAADTNEPDLTGFDPYNTFYVYWDENGVEHNETPINQDEPAGWYDYSIRSWANIVTRNNGTDSYFVWIPRYQYALDTVSQRVYVRFIKGKGTQTASGYTIPEAFTWGDGSNNVQLEGYWMSKYQLSEKSSTPVLSASISAGSTKAKVGTITGSAVTDNTDNIKFEYYVDGTKVHEGEDPDEQYSFTGLTPKTTYGLTVIARNKETNAYLGAVTQKTTTIVINAPDLTGFVQAKTYYVTFDNEGNPVVGNNIAGEAPSEWYDYTDKKWANIVVTDGTVSNGTISGATYTSYFVWIPRYEYMLDTTNQRVDVKFLEGKSTTADTGYTIPEAFTWGDGNNNVQIEGYWMSKYQLSN